MKHYILLYMALFALIGVSCQKKRSQVCEIAIDVSKDANDSISVFCYEPDYNRSRIIFTGRVDNGHLLLADNDNTGVPHVAYFVCGDDSVAHYFVLEPGSVKINIEKDIIRIEGSRSNYELFSFRRHINAIDSERLRLQENYLKDVCDSVLTQSAEEIAFKRDSVLSDSIQRLLVMRIGRGDAVARILKEQYSTRRSSDSWNKIE